MVVLGLAEFEEKENMKNIQDRIERERKMLYIYMLNRGYEFPTPFLLRRIKDADGRRGVREHGQCFLVLARAEPSHASRCATMPPGGNNFVCTLLLHGDREYRISVSLARYKK